MKIEIDEDNRVLTIEGIRYTFELFKDFGASPPGTLFRIESRDDGVLTIRTWTRLSEAVRELEKE